MKDRIRFELDSLFGLLLGMTVLGTGVAKLAGTDFVVATFGGWEDALWTLRAIGLAEIIAAALVLIPATRAKGATIIGIVMVGASAYHLSRGEFLAVALPVALLVVTSMVLYCRANLSLRENLEPVREPV